MQGPAKCCAHSCFKGRVELPVQTHRPGFPAWHQTPQHQQCPNNMNMWHAHRRSHVAHGIPSPRDHEDGQISLIPQAEVITEEIKMGPMGLNGLEHRRQLCDSGLPDVDMCELVEPPPSYPAVEEAVSRGKWLLGLLILQSTSSFVLDSYQELLREHLVVTLFLTMLVGAGGNAGNQSAVKIIRGLATGSIKPSWQSIKNTLAEQATVGLLLGAGLGLGGFVRVYITNGNLLNSISISLSLFTIVMISVVLGTSLPFAFTKVGIDPANAGTSIQVIMDILGVAVTCGTCQLILVQFAESLPK